MHSKLERKMAEHIIYLNNTEGADAANEYANRLQDEFTDEGWESLIVTIKELVNAGGNKNK